MHRLTSIPRSRTGCWGGSTPVGAVGIRTLCAGVRGGLGGGMWPRGRDRAQERNPRGVPPPTPGVAELLLSSRPGPSPSRKPFEICIVCHTGWVSAGSGFCGSGGGSCACDTVGVSHSAIHPAPRGGWAGGDGSCPWKQPDGSVLPGERAKIQSTCPFGRSRDWFCTSEGWTAEDRGALYLLSWEIDHLSILFLRLCEQPVFPSACWVCPAITATAPGGSSVPSPRTGLAGVKGDTWCRLWLILRRCRRLCRELRAGGGHCSTLGWEFGVLG